MEQVLIEYRWDETMRTGDETSDTQHRELIRQMNMLLSAMAVGEGTAQIAPLPDFLANYTVAHFRQEEELMETYHCPAAAANKTAHTEFLKKFGDYTSQLKDSASGSSAASIQLLRELSGWLLNHIRSIDAQMLPYAQKVK